MSLPQEALNQNVYQAIDDCLNEFIDSTEYDFLDISSELYRVYIYPDGTEVVIDEPVLLHVSPSGGHRLFDLTRTSHYVVPGFVHIFWLAREGEPNFIS